MRKKLSILVVLIVAFAGLPALTSAASTPTGCPATWGMKLENGIETTGLLRLAQRAYGNTKMYYSIVSKASAGNTSFEGLQRINLNGQDMRSWSLVATALEQNTSINQIDTLKVVFAGCSDYVLTSNREPLSVRVSEEIRNFDEILNEWVRSYDAMNPTKELPLQLKDSYKSNYQTWITRILRESSQPSSEKFVKTELMGFDDFAPGFNFMLVPKKGSSCLFRISSPAYSGELGLKRGCIYDVVTTPNYTGGNFLPSIGINLVRIGEVKFSLLNEVLPSPTSTPKTTSSSKSSNSIKTIRCQKGTLIKKFQGFNPICPRGYSKL